jgi:phenylpropionate dioxygenase-like ring-hydroxylating dioxygenase large terminal subunit
MIQNERRRQVEERVNKGLLGQWYAVTKSSWVEAGRPHAVKALERNLVLWRDSTGTLHCLEDSCPHRGARLSRGEIIDDNIACRYHGVTLDSAGTVVRVPAMPDCPLEGRKAVASFAVMEAADGVFVYFPSADQPEPQPFALPYEFTRGEYQTFLCTSVWQCNHRYVLDNLVDPMHGCYLHSNSFTLALGARQDLMRVEEQGDGFIVTRVAQRGENFDWTEMVTETAAPYCRLDIPYPPAAGPGGQMRIVGFVTPLDEHSTRVFFWRTRKVSGLEREAWKFMYRALLEERHWAVLEQDRDILESMPEDARRHELLYQHDIGVTRLRLIMARKAEQQIEKESQNAVRAAN